VTGEFHLVARGELLEQLGRQGRVRVIDLVKIMHAMGAAEQSPCKLGPPAQEMLRTMAGEQGRHPGGYDAAQ
jgi:hypothetical protein